MRREFAVALPLLLLAARAAGQQPGMPTPRPALAQLPSVTVHYAGPGVTAPELYPPTVSIYVPRRCIDLDGVVKLSALVDENGVPRGIQTLQSDDARLNDFATELVAEQRFRPGTYNNSRAAVAIAVTAALHTCVLPAKKKLTEENTALTLRSHPFIEVTVLASPPASSETASPAPVAFTANSGTTNQLAGSTGAPTPIFQPNPQYTRLAKRNNIVGTCLIGATVDAFGVPQDVDVVSSLEPSLDENAIEAIKTWRFNPALQGGSVPVPFGITIAVTFWHQEKMFISFTTILPKPSSAVIFSVTPNSANNISAPVLLNADEFQPEYSPYGQLARITGMCVVAFIVDTNGVPQNVRVVKSLESSMDANVVAAVNEMRFKPALKSGTTPVVAEVIMPVNFKLRIPKRQMLESALTAAIFIFGI